MMGTQIVAGKDWQPTRQERRVLTPGIRTLPQGTERYVVAGCGTLVLTASAGDHLILIDREGRQRCEVLAFDGDGRNISGSMGAAANGSGAGVKELASTGNGALPATLARQGITLDDARSVDLFGAGAAAGERAVLQVQQDCVVVVAAPGAPMRVDAQDAPTEIEVLVERAEPPAEAVPYLPEPLAAPRLDFRVNRATAESYLVRAGEYVQVIDVEGRQCSDFQAFPRASLDRGLDRCLDVTTTRSLVGAAYPGPGLLSKYFDQDMQALVEVVQDTCGRHDAFGLACTAKYYEDQGYPGHVNCSENFNRVLAPHGVAPRRGWMAMNFFFNTGIDAHNQLHADDPWSRPGDYVLLRALTDLVCVSSACPDDIDAANAWNPTDIHLRVYSPEKTFAKSIGFRKTTESEAQMTKETGFHPRTSALTRDFAEYRGYWLPNSFTNHGALAEYWACREKATVMDLSPLRKVEVLGPDAEVLLQQTLTRNVRRLAVGQVVYSAMCYDTGGMIDDGTLFRLGAENFRWIGGDDYGGIWLREQAEKLGLNAWVKSSSDQLHNLAVQGPQSRAILSEIIWTPPTQPTLDELAWFRFTIGRTGHADGTAVIVSRTGYTGELGYEVWCHPNDAVTVWDAIWQAGQPHGLTPLGLEGLDILRIEAGLIFAGYEFDDQTDPFEAGIGFTVPLKSKEDDFIGKEALSRRKAHPQRVLVGLELAGEEPAAHGDCIHIGRQQIGVVTSGCRSPILRKNIALARVAVDHANLGMELEVGKLDGHQKRIPATVVRFPFYDPDKTRVRS